MRKVHFFMARAFSLSPKLLICLEILARSAPRKKAGCADLLLFLGQLCVNRTPRSGIVRLKDFRAYPFHPHTKKSRRDLLVGCGALVKCPGGWQILGLDAPKKRAECALFPPRARVSLLSKGKNQDHLAKKIHAFAEQPAPVDAVREVAEDDDFADVPPPTAADRAEIQRYLAQAAPICGPVSADLAELEPEPEPEPPAAPHRVVGHPSLHAHKPAVPVRPWVTAFTEPLLADAARQLCPDHPDPYKVAQLLHRECKRNRVSASDLAYAAYSLGCYPPGHVRDPLRYALGIIRNQMVKRGKPAPKFEPRVFRCDDFTYSFRNT
jgi:hypothetical protein